MQIVEPEIGKLVYMNIGEYILHRLFINKRTVVKLLDYEIPFTLLIFHRKRRNIVIYKLSTLHFT